MKRNILVRLALVVLMLSLVGTVYASDLAIDLQAVEADDIFNNIWGIDPIAESATGETRFYAAVGGDTLYIWVEGLVPDPFNNIFFDTDLDAATGYAGWQWPDMGGDYRVTNGDFFVSTGSSWNWEKVTEVEHVRFDVDGKTAFMTAINLDLFGEIDSFRIAFSGETIIMPARDKNTVQIDLF